MTLRYDDFFQLDIANLASLLFKKSACLKQDYNSCMDTDHTAYSKFITLHMKA